MILTYNTIQTVRVMYLKSIRSILSSCSYTFITSSS